jgi:hypothetical protein
MLDWIVANKIILPKDHLQARFSQNLEEWMQMEIIFLQELILWIIHKLLTIEIQSI